jgi:hypothetical protein
LIRNCGFLENPTEFLFKIFHIVAEFHDCYDPLDLVVHLLLAEIFQPDMKIGCNSGIFDPIEFKVW